MTFVYKYFYDTFKYEQYYKMDIKYYLRREIKNKFLSLARSKIHVEAGLEDLWKLDRWKYSNASIFRVNKVTSVGRGGTG